MEMILALAELVRLSRPHCNDVSKSSKVNATFTPCINVLLDALRGICWCFDVVVGLSIGWSVLLVWAATVGWKEWGDIWRSWTPEKKEG